MKREAAAAKKSAGKRPIPFSLKTFAKFCLAGFLALTLSGGALIFWGCREILIDADVAVVLGNEVYSSGKPSPRLAARLDKALDLYRSGKVKTLIVSGGVGLSGVDEATAMAAYLKARGVAPKSVVVDSRGTNTWNTARFTAAWLRENGRDGVIVVSQHFHVPRSALAMKAAGCPRVGQASPDYWEAWDVYSVFREIPANMFYWWRYSGTSAAEGPL